MLSRNDKVKIVVLVSLFLGFLLSNASKLDREDFNVIIISLDALRADHLGVYGYYRNTSLNIDEFASKSTLFDNAIAQATWTIPSHMSLFTSLYPLSHKVIGPDDVLNENIVTFAETMKKNGYTTAAFTAWGWPLSPKNGLGKGFDLYEQIDYSKARLEDLKKSSIHYLDESNPVFGWLKNNKDRKFFLFFHTFSIHDPYIVSKNYSKIFDPDYDGSILDSEEEYIDLLWNNYIQNYTVEPNEAELIKAVGDTLVAKTINFSDPRDREHLKAVYDAKILQTDEFIRLFLEKIEKLRLSEKTIIILLADHGEEFWDHNKLGHGHQLYEETIRVPLIIHNPNMSQGIRIKRQAQLVDIMPTVLDMLSMKIPDSIQGKSLMPVILGNPNKDFNEYVFAVNHVDMFTVRTNEWKLIFRLNGNHELYNLVSDPKETDNLIEKREEKFIELREKLLEWDKSTGIKRSEVIAIESVEEKLRKLGYIT